MPRLRTNRLPTNIYSAASVREIDRRAIAAGTPGLELMQRAGEFAFETALQRWPECTRWQVVCGPGNNAGDGYVVATLAAQKGVPVSVVSLVDPEQLVGDAATAYQDCIAAGVAVTRWQGGLDEETDLIVDGLLGRGALRAIAGEFAAAISAMNQQEAPVLALDIASGLQADTGEMAGAAVCASATCSFVGLSAGLFAAAGRHCTGDLYFSDLDINADIHGDIAPVYQRLDLEQRGDWLPRRAYDAHKGDFGHVLVVGGGPGMPGAVRICAEAALRTGAGRVSVATHSAHTAAIVAGCPELMVHGIECREQLRDLLRHVDVVAFGPGLGQSEWAEQLFTEISATTVPSIWDADALNYLSNHEFKSDARIITPHPGEAATLLHQTTATVQSDRPAALRALRATYGGAVVLKGASTLTLGETDLPWLNTTGNPGMAAAGMGDALTGVVAGLLAQGLTPERAAALGALVHGAAGDRAAAGGERGTMATDLIAKLRGVVNL